MKQRIITAIIGLILFVPVVYMGSWILELVVAVLGIIALFELFRMKGNKIFTVEGIISIIALLGLLLPQYAAMILPEYMDTQMILYLFVLLLLVCTVFSKNNFTFDDVAVSVLGIMYIGFGFRFLLLTRYSGLDLLLFVLFVVWATDIGAYLIGRKLGKHKLAPSISPNKTIEGAVGGVVMAMIVAFIYLTYYPQNYNIGWMLALTFILSIAGQLGDLVESAFKRYYGVKDSGNLLPGHGGILDRFDSLLFVLPVIYYSGLI
ncbi:phosphatidate cytidylyltransferase [Carnobacterium alterfunditum]|uniref:Phosphatidate cytidylyltransferase n=1 Tax=Carnobacterium alterfunditum TaxID=28230 RepID=A0A1N6GXT4_9LACT|nr:phosphatidate cytidylyltransferase [Carnobacterium alterfunditum]SIO12349.1 phosphatidate cytidylyltransferase [Carnobacterium alterfunditum]